jgi:coproporphyrinogen III oxidase-like Fe-S oxidoreductase
MGLRLTQEGASQLKFTLRFGQSLEEIFGVQIGRLENLGLLEWADYDDEKVLRLTQKGRLLGNQVFMEFI